jgi:integrase
MVNRTRREEEQTWPPIYRRPHSLRHSGSSRLSTGTSERTLGSLFSSVPCTELRSSSGLA